MDTLQELLSIAKVRGPLAKRADGAGEIILATSGTAVRVIIPTWLQGKTCSFKASGAACEVLFGGSTVEVVYGQATTVAAEAMTVHANTGRRLSTEETRDWKIPYANELGLGVGATLYMSVEAAAAGTLHIGLAQDSAIGHEPGK